MNTFLRVREDLNLRPNIQQYFAGRITRSTLMVQITNDCTNRCSHCTNRSEPSGARQLYAERASLADFWRQAKEAGFSRVHLWGGEPFLHPSLHGFAQDIFSSKLNLWVSTNAFFGSSERNIENHISPIIGAELDSSIFTLLLSCDTLHQCQAATPIDNIAQVLAFASRVEGDKIRVRINSVVVPGDQTLASLLQKLGNDWEMHNGNFSTTLTDKRTGFTVTVSFSNLENEFGRAAETRQTLSPPLRFAKRVADGTHVSLGGNVFILDNFVGAQVYPVGNVFSESLSAIMEKTQGDVVARMLYGDGLPALLLAFRRYQNVSELVAGAGSSKAIVKRLWIAGDPYHDKSTQLEDARQCLVTEASDSHLTDALNTITAFGDFTDTERLRKIIEDTSVKDDIRWAALFGYWVVANQDRMKYTYEKTDSDEIILVPQNYLPHLTNFRERPIPRWVRESVPPLIWD